MKYLFAAIAFFTLSSIFCQTNAFKISGRVIAESDSIPLESATVYLERAKDTTLVTYTITDKDGNFLLEDKTYEEKLNLTIAYVGYETYVRNITLNREEIILGQIKMRLANALDEVLIKSRAPVTIKKDTLEFNVKSFKTKKDANVEDLLKKLPGVEVDDEGNITVNGKPVNKILVNGKPFFGDDPTITTRNLTKEIIDKVQVTDTKTKSEAFTGQEGDKENKTINLTIKEENNKGQFGRLSGGAGTDERYEYAGIVNFFDNDQRISVLAGGNNTNSPGFSFGEIQKMFGSGGSMYFNSNGSFAIGGRSFGGGQGITTSTNVGANYNDKLNEEIDLSGNYFYAGSSSDNQTITNRETILPDTRFFTNSTSSSTNEINDHSAEMQFEIEIDTTFRIDVEPRFQFTKNTDLYDNSETTLNEDGVQTNSATVNSFREDLGKNFSNQLNVTKKFGSAGSFLKLRLDTDFNTIDGKDFLFSETLFQDSNNDIIRDQFTEDDQTAREISSSLEYRLPLVAKKIFLDFKYNIRDNKRENLRSTFDFNEETQEYNIFNESLSTDFTFEDVRHTPSMAFVIREEKWSFSVEPKLVFRTLENKDQLRPQLDFEQDFEAFELRSNFNVRFSQKSSIYTGYSLNNQPPQLSQLRPFVDVSNPLNTVTGNPNLEPSSNHSLYGGYNNFDWQKKTGFNLYFNGGIVQNQIVQKTTVDPETLTRETTFANVDGNYRANLSGSYSKNIKIDTLQSLRVRVGAYSNLRNNVNFFNDVKYNSRRISLTPNLRLTYTYKGILELEPNYRINLVNTEYDINNFNDINFVTHNLGIKTATFIPKNFEWRNDINFSYNPNIAEGFQRSAWFWNSTLAYSFLQDKATLTLKVYDLLNQNTNARRTTSDNFILDSQSTVLQQYFMINLSWKFNSLGKKGETNDNPFWMF